MSKTVWVIMWGSYSDLCMECVFSTKEKAYNYYNYNVQHNDELHEPECWTLDEPWEKKERITQVTMNINGESRIIKLKVVNDYTKPGFVHFHIWQNDWFIYNVRTEDEQTAIKVTNEKRSIILANNLWGKKELCKEMFGDGGW